MQVRQERTGWRDEEISTKHREWGFNCPAADLDFLLVEFNLGKPAALIEYKRNGALMPNFNHPTYRALNALADAANLPFMVVFYHPEGGWWFRVYPINEPAKAFYNGISVLTEQEFVASLYRLRGLVVQQQLLRKLNVFKPVAKS